MSNHLIESILDKNFVIAESQLNDRLNSIMEKKLYEKKRMIAADMNEAMGGLTKKEIEDRKKAGYRRAAEVLGDPSKGGLKPLFSFKKVKKKVSEAVSVEPDPEGRVRGGSGKAGTAKGTFKRNAKAAGLRFAGKVGYGAGRVIGAGLRAGQTVADIISKTRELKKSPQAKRKAAPDTETKPVEKDYTGAGNTPSAMIGRFSQHVAKKFRDHEPAPVGSRTLRVAKTVGKGIGKAAKFVANDIAASIGEESK